jgi:plasmid stabilization system protein ParE
MDNIAEAVALLHRQAELEIRLANNPSAAVATERELEHLLRRLATNPHAVNAVLQTALALRRTPDAITARDVETWTPAI